MSIDIFPAQEDNIEALADLYRDARIPLIKAIAPEQMPFWETKDWCSPWRKHFAAKADKARAFVAWKEGAPVGFCRVGKVDELYSPYLHKIDLSDCGELDELYLCLPLIGTGLGKTLMMYAMQALHDLGYNRMIVCVDLANERAQHFYEAFGLTAVRDVKLSMQRVNGGFICPVRFMIGPV